MKIGYYLRLLAGWALAAHASPMPQMGTESGGGIAPWANTSTELVTPSPESEPDASLQGPIIEPQSPGAPAAAAVPVGTIITRCTVGGTVALTFDDGPYIYTSQILDILRRNAVPATFFVNGANWQSIETEASRGLIRRMNNEGHQIGSHTWGHPDLATLNRDGIISQMSQLDNALKGIIGQSPTYMRSPYFSTNDLVLRTMRELGYKVIHASIDTLDWQNNAPDRIQTSVQLFRDGLNAGGSIALSHDVHQWTANVLTQGMIDEVRRRGLRPVPVGECLGDPKSAWYRT